MNHVGFGREKRILLGLVFALFSCASVPVVSRDAAPGRIPASITSNFGLDCVKEAAIFRDYDGSENFESFDSDLSRAFSGLTAEQKEQATALALAEAFAYGQKLLADYEALLDQGLTLEEIMRTKSVYAELQALYFLRHDLERFAENQVARVLLDRMQVEGGGDPERGVALIDEASNSSLSRWRSHISSRLSDEGYGTLALAETESALADLRLMARACKSRNVPSDFPVHGMVKQSLTLGSSEKSTLLLAIDNSARVLSAARSLAKNPLAYRAFQPRSGERTSSVESIVKSRAQEIRKEWSALTGRSPQNAPEGKIIYPDAGKAGNIYGTGFPKGVWALTFDDGPHGGTKTVSSYTRTVLENLKSHKMKATFFVLSQQIERKDCLGVGPRTVRVLDKEGNVVSEKKINIRRDRPGEVYPELALAERDAGHAVASHSYYHSQVPKGNSYEQNCEINQAAAVLAEKMGKRPEYFRLPYGAGVSVPGVRTQIAAAGMVHVHWSVDTLDWQDHDPESIVRRTLKAMKADGRGIILFHDVHPQSVVASEKIMAYLKDPANQIETLTIPEIVDRMNGAKPDPEGHFGSH